MTRPLLALLAAAPLCAAAEPLTLDEALAQASRQSHDLAISRADAGLAGADSLTATAGLLPRLDFTTAGGRQVSGDTTGVRNVQVTDPITGEVSFEQRSASIAAKTFESYSLDLVLVQPLVDVAAWRQLARARAAERAAAQLHDENRLTVAFEVTRRFYELVKATRTLAVLEKAAARSEELVSRADALYGAGRAQKADTYAARVNLGNDRIAAEQARARLVQARADLATALGRPGDAGVEAVPPAALEGPGLPSAEAPALETLLATARSRRPTVAAAAAQVQAAEAALGAARAGYLPTLSAQATYDRAGQLFSGRDGVFGDPSRQYVASAQLVLSWNLFAGRSTEATVDRARLTADRTRATAARTLDAVARELTAGRQAVVSQALQVALAAENLGAAEQGLSLARQRLEAGLASQLEVRDAALKLTQAELSLVQARIDHAVAAADLNRAVGGAL